MKVNLKYFSAVLIVGLVFISIGNSFAQKIFSEEWKKKKKETKERKIKEGRWMIMPLAGPAYTPELQFTVAGGVMTSFRTDKKDTTLQRSSMPVMLGVSSTGALFFGTKVTSFWKSDKLRIYGDFNFKDMPDNYWGVGYDAGRYTEKSDSTTAYDRLWWQIYPRFLWQFKTHYFAGLTIDYNYTQGTDPSMGVVEDPYFNEYNEKPLNSGLGLIFQYDSRDIPVNAWSGLFLEAMMTIYRTGLGGDNDYEIYGLDIRKYWGVGSKRGRTVAVQGRGRFGRGHVPYGEMSQLGTPFDLRGYTWGQYRNNTMIYTIGEYRHTCYKNSGEISKHGVVGWLGAGTIGSDVQNFEKYLPNVGVGYRLEVQPRMNLRLDIGFGTETYGFYFNFNEAF
ncbi:MAG: BamA/TamA family outer membrane protein [Reichenbachiella sp.]